MEISVKRMQGLSGAVFNSNDETVAEAINSIYCNDSRKWEFVFCNISISVCMFCIADVYADMVGIVQQIEANKRFKASFLSPEITCAFEIEMHDKKVLVTSAWTSAGTDEHINELRELPQPSSFDKEKFLSELRNFLQSVKNDLISVGYAHLFNARHPWGIRLY